MKKNILCGLGTLVLCALLSESHPAQADAVLDWDEHAVQAIVGVAKKSPALAPLDLVIVHAAIYDAVNAIAGYPFDAYAVKPTITQPASPEAATAAAAHDVLVALYPAQQPDLDTEYQASLASIPDGAAKTNGIAVGQQTAAGIVALRADDGRNDVVPYTPGSGPGVWIPTPPAFLPAAAPQLATTQPWTLDSPDQFRAPGPPKLSSTRWAQDYNEVKAFGRATDSARTPDQTDIGLFWTEHGLTQWSRAWRGISVIAGLSLEDNARLFALLTMVMSDGLIACWDSKYTYNFWRPVTAIPAGDTDGNSKTVPDPAWLPLAVTPNHPEYPSAHGCASGAITDALKRFFGTDTFAFTIDSTVPGLIHPVHAYTKFSQAIDEIAVARIYGGMHYRFSTAAGVKIGKQVSRFATRHFFRQTKSH